ncbi:hypothetical protein [Orenia marismortui]|uniref:Uncharacterized protein n=1 Tax=Orenia marismortui TaxID=46469 RepID=A0A4R8H109_9FIRM|nr:hypothetical protein [Orenia marismortui]TDX53242.1 hypothetical protein C7959_10394 [Orenia marismortui]
MKKEELNQVINKIYQNISKTNNIISVPYAQNQILAQLGEKVDSKLVKELLIENDELLILTRDQFICKSYFSDLFWNNLAYKTSLAEIKTILKNEYFVLKDIKVKSLLESFEPEFLNFLEKKDSQGPLLVKQDDDLYTIDSEERLLKYGVEHGSVSYDLVQEYSQRYDEDYFDLIGKIVHKNIHCGDYDEEILEKNKYDKNYYRLKDLDYSNDNNALLVDLRLNQLIALLLLMNDRENLINKLNEAKRNKYKRDLTRLGLINSETLIPTREGKELATKIRDIAYSELDYGSINEIEDQKYGIKDLCKLESVKSLEHNDDFWNKAALPLRDHFLSLPSVKIFVSWIKDINRQGKYSMYDLFQYLIEKEYYAELKWLLVGDSPSSSLKKIKSSLDICIQCNSFNSCTSYDKNSNSDKIKFLLDIRNNEASKIISQIKKVNRMYDYLLQKPILIKFIVPYNLTSKAKLIKEKINILKNDEILHKKDGDYCVYRDNWRVNNDLLV